MGGGARLGRLGGAGDHQRHLGAGRHVHLRAHRAHLGHELDEPADLGVGVGILQAAMARPFRQHQQAVAALAFRHALGPQLLGDEGHEGMQQLERVIEHEGGHGAGLGLAGLVLAHEDRLDELQIPVAVDVPDEVIDGAGGLVEAEGLERLGDGGGRALGLAGDPAVDA